MKIKKNSKLLQFLIVVASNLSSSQQVKVGLLKIEESGKLFDGVDLNENEWVDYDDKIKESVGIYDLQSQFIKIK
jgi:hypothetical protein